MLRGRRKRNRRNNFTIIKIKKENIHFLHDFLLNSKNCPGFLHDKIGILQNDAIARAQECRQQNMGHNRERAAKSEITETWSTSTDQQI